MAAQLSGPRGVRKSRSRFQGSRPSRTVPPVSQGQVNCRQGLHPHGSTSRKEARQRPNRPAQTAPCGRNTRSPLAQRQRRPCLRPDRSDGRGPVHGSVSPVLARRCESRPNAGEGKDPLPGRMRREREGHLKPTLCTLTFPLNLRHHWADSRLDFDCGESKIALEMARICGVPQRCIRLGRIAHERSCLSITPHL
jgi:hypothetical protein